MRKIDSIEDQMRGVVTYEIGDGRCIQLDAREIRGLGLKVLMEAYGIEIPKERIPVFQDGREIGSVPAFFEPMAIKSTSYLYDVRPGDFMRTDKGWEAARSLGPGDIQAVPDFQWNDPQQSREMSRIAEEEREILMSVITGSKRV